MPGSSHFTAIATLGSPLESFCKELGVDLDAMARAVGLDANVFQKEAARINLEAFTRLLHRLCEVTENDSLGIRYGSFYSLGDSGTFDFALLNCGRLREALEFYSLYQPLLADYVFFNIEIGQEFSSIEWRNSGKVTHSSTYVDFRAVLKVKMLRRFLGQNYVPSRVDLVRSPPRSNTEHKRALGPNLHFNALMNKISFPSSLLDAVSDQSDKRLFNLLKANCDEQLARLLRPKDILLRVKETIIASLPNGVSTLPMMAEELGMSERSLQRRLSDRGAGYERLVEEARRELSDDLLTSRTPLSDIAALCGFSTVSAYSRAAKAWYGEPPSKRRSKLMQSI